MRKQLKILLNFFSVIDFPYKKGIVFRLFKNQFAKMKTGWYPIYTGHVWKLDVRNSCHAWMLYDRYADASFLKWAERNISKDAVIVDSGSNIGQFLPYFSNIARHGKILAFEPGKELGDWVQECLKKNNLKVELFRSGLGNKEFKAFLNSWGDEEIHGLWGQVNEEKGEPINITRLDKVLKDKMIDKVDLWKLDVEGYEIEALEGAGAYLNEKQIKALYIELAIKEDNHTRILKYMLEKGYKPFYFNKFGKLKPLTQLLDEQIDALFLPE